MGFNPLEHHGISPDRRPRSRREPGVEPIDPDHIEGREATGQNG